jgi:gliding motility-associated-like protein
MIDIAAAGDYILTVANDIGCMASDQLRLALQPSAVFDLGDVSTICEGEQISYMVNVGYDAIIWSTGATTNSVNINQSGVYWAETTLNGCTYRDSTELIVQAFPTLALPNDTTLCEGEQFNAMAVSNANELLWNTGQTTSDITISTSGTFSVIASTSGCETSSSFNVTVNPTPNFSLGQDQVICEGEQVTLTAQGTALPITWSTGENTPAITVDQNGIYSATATTGGCSFTDEVRVDIESLPVFDLGGNIFTCDNQPVTLIVPRNDVDVIWSTGDAGRSITTSQLGRITATAMTAIGCTYADEVTISDRDCQRFSAYVPNSFSPNGDNTNDELRIGLANTATIHEYELRIFDRQGNLMFISDDPNIHWDGLVGTNGQQAAIGVYVYALRVRFSDDFDQNRLDMTNGSITLIR